MPSSQLLHTIWTLNVLFFLQEIIQDFGPLASTHRTSFKDIFQCLKSNLSFYFQYSIYQKFYFITLRLSVNFTWECAWGPLQIPECAKILDLWIIFTDDILAETILQIIHLLLIWREINLFDCSSSTEHPKPKLFEYLSPCIHGLWW